MPLARVATGCMASHETPEWTGDKRATGCVPSRQDCNFLR